MIYTGRRCMPRTDEDIMEDEILETKKLLNKYEENLKTLLPKNLADEVRRSMINFLVEKIG